MKKFFLTFFFLPIIILSYAQVRNGVLATKWVDSVFNSLSDSARISQLIIIRAYPNDTGVAKTAALIGPAGIEKAVTDHPFARGQRRREYQRRNDDDPRQH